MKNTTKIEIDRYRVYSRIALLLLELRTFIIKTLQ